MSQVSVLSASTDPTLLLKAHSGTVVITTSAAIKVNNDFDDLDAGHGVALATGTVYSWNIHGEPLYATAAADATVQVLAL